MPADGERTVAGGIILSAVSIRAINSPHKVVDTLVRNTYTQAEFCLPRLAAAGLFKMMEYTVEEGKLRFDMTLPAGSSVNLNPGLLVQFLQTICSDDLSSAVILRTAVLKTDGTPFV